jgi:hypothetical protein
MDRVTVYRFTLDDADPETGACGLAPRAATAEAIHCILGASPVEGSAQVVDKHCVDRRGFLVEDCTWADSGAPQ